MFPRTLELINTFNNPRSELPAICLEVERKMAVHQEVRSFGFGVEKGLGAERSRVNAGAASLLIGSGWRVAWGEMGGAGSWTNRQALAASPPAVLFGTAGILGWESRQFCRPTGQRRWNAISWPAQGRRRQTGTLCNKTFFCCAALRPAPCHGPLIPSNALSSP